MDKNFFTFEDHLNVGTREFLLECSIKIAQMSTLSGADALSLVTSVLRSGVVESRNHLALEIQKRKECEDVLRFYTHSWDSGEEAVKYFENEKLLAKKLGDYPDSRSFLR